MTVAISHDVLEALVVVEALHGPGELHVFSLDAALPEHASPDRAGSGVM
jgi:hypothetical protein